MKLNDMILVIENKRGEETNYLSNFEDYLERIEKAYSDSTSDRAFAVEKLLWTKQGKGEWSEVYITSNETYRARFCLRESDLRTFLLGLYNEERTGDKIYVFEKERCSKECLEVLKAYGINTRGRGVFNSLHYEALEHTFIRGETIRNMNGDVYRVLSVLDHKNLLLLEEKDGQILVGVNTTYYKRTPKEGYDSSDIEVYGVEWDYGIYLGFDITEVNIEKLKRDYGSRKEIENLSDYRDNLSSMFNKYQNLCEDVDVSKEVKRAAAESLANLFGTDNRDTFLDFLIRGYYDGGFQGQIEAKKEKVR